MKTWLLRASVVACFATTSSGAFAQIPVTDVASLTQQIQQVMSWMQQYEQMIESIEKYKTQIENQEKQIKAITGGRGMGSLQSSGTQQKLPSDFTSIADKLRSQGAGGASAGAKAVYDSIKTYACAERFPKDVASQRSCEASALAIPSNIALLNDSVDSAKKRQNELKSYAGSIDSASDAKAAADLTNRLTLEVAYLQNEKMMMEMAAKQLEEQKKLTAQKKAEEGTKRMTNSSGGGTNPFAGSL